MSPTIPFAAIAAPSFVLGAAFSATILLWQGDGLRLTALLSPATEHQPGAASAVPDTPHSYADAVSRAAPAVVSIYISRDSQRSPSAATAPPNASHNSSRFAPPIAQPPYGQVSLGSGVLVSNDGLLLTNRHVIAGATSISAELSDGRVLEVALLGVDEETDLALLRIEAAGLPAISIGNPNALRVGDVVLAIGNPFGIGQTVSMGIVSATGRGHLGLTGIEHFIQTDAAINPGNSGGPLIDADGRLVGINTAILSNSGLSEGVGFAIPADLALRVVQDIALSGSVDRGWLGIAGRSLTPQLAKRFGLRAPHGVLVTSVGEDSPAARAGLRAGDVVTSANGHLLRSSYELLDAVTQAGPAVEVKLQVWRGSDRMETLAITAERPPGGVKQRMDVSNRPGQAPTPSPACMPSGQHPGGC